MVLQVHQATAAENVARFDNCVASSIHTLGQALHPCVEGILHCNFFLSLYLAIALGMGLQAWNAWQEQDHRRVRAHGFTSLLNVLEALLHLHG
jgi:hypothetical protein